MKRIIRQIMGWSLMLSLPLVMTSCGELFDMLDNPITPALQVLRAQLTLKVGESKPIQASTQAHVVLLYSSDNPAVATVDATGLITAVSPGTARITIKAQGEDDYYRTEIFSENTTTVEVTVTKKDGSISFATSNVIKSFGDDAFTNPLTIVGDGTVTYSSNNSNVATVDANGNVTIVDGGTAIITATTATTDEYAYKTDYAQYTLRIIKIIDLSTLTSDYIAQDNNILTGTLAGYYKISIAEDANVELKDVTINGVNKVAYRWAGLTCLGDANITITGTNSVKGFYENYPGIQAGRIGTKLTINGTGTLTATGGDFAAGIGSGFNGSSCGDITISGGTVNASSGSQGAGIGSGYIHSSCGDITISGGTVNASSSGDGAGIGSGYSNSSCKNITISGGDITASSGKSGAGIGSGYHSSFGNVTITSGITKVQATSNDPDAWPIGKGYCDQSSSSSTVTIAKVTVTGRDWDGTGLFGTGLTLTGAGTNTWTLSHPTAP